MTEVDIDKQFEHTATGVLGNKRETMLHNDLLQRPYVGHKLARGYTSYPGERHRYGLVQPNVQGGVAAALRGWSTGGLYYTKQTGPKKHASSNRDFVALNKAAVSAGLTSAQQINEFRTTHDFQKKPGLIYGHVPIRRLPPSTVYGKPSRPATPINQVMEHYYQDEWIKHNRRLNKDEPLVLKKMPLVAGDTKTSKLRVYQVPVESAPLWQLPKFSANAQPQLQTFRSAKARDAAFKYHSVAQY